MNVQEREDEERRGDRWREARSSTGSKENKRQMESVRVCVHMEVSFYPKRNLEDLEEKRESKREWVVQRGSMNTGLP